MKQYSKSVVIVLAVLCLVVFSVSFLGIHTAYGDITTDIINGVHLVPRGFGLTGSVTVFLQQASGAEEEAPEIDYAHVKRVFEERLALSNVAEHEVYATPDNRGFVVKMPYDRYTSESLMGIRRMLVNDGTFVFRDGVQDEEGNPTGNVILGNGHIRTAAVSMEATVSGYVYVVNVTLTGEGQRLLAAAVEERINGEDPSLEFSCWINGAQTDTYTAADLTESEFVQVTRDDGYTLSTAAEVATMLRTEPLGTTFSVFASNIDENAAPGGYGLLTAAFGVSLLLTGILLTVKYRIVGLCSFLAMLGSFGVVQFVLTNFGGSAMVRGFSLTSAGAFAALLFVYVLVARRDAERIRSSLGGGSLQKAVIGGFSKNFASSAALFFVLFVTGVLMFDFFNRKGGWIVTAIRWVFPEFVAANYAQFSELGILLLTGAVSGFLLMLFGNRLMVRSTLGFKRLAHDGNYGGVKNAAE